ncbi:hypothetical protein [Lacinutrix jangbogonensis]|nr:hypothetical protein [Lacinutrix jangbogonensis]
MKKTLISLVIFIIFNTSFHVQHATDILIQEATGIALPKEGVTEYVQMN